MNPTKQTGFAAADARDRVLAMARDAGVAMLTTRGSDGLLSSRPMRTITGDGNDYLWFFATEDPAWTDDVGGGAPVVLTYTDTASERYLSISGTADRIDDRRVARRRWDRGLEKWIPGGLDDPNLVVIRVTIAFAEEWEGANSRRVNWKEDAGNG